MTYHKAPRNPATDAGTDHHHPNDRCAITPNAMSAKNVKTGKIPKIQSTQTLNSTSPQGSAPTSALAQVSQAVIVTARSPARQPLATRPNAAARTSHEDR